MTRREHSLWPFEISTASNWIFTVLTVSAGLMFSQTGLRAAEAEPSTLEKEPDGWVDILPGASLDGWYRVAVPRSGKLGREQWHVDSARKVLVCDGDGGHDMLLFAKEAGDVIFHFEFCYTPVEGKTGYNSGAYVRNSKDGGI